MLPNLHKPSYQTVFDPLCSMSELEIWYDQRQHGKITPKHSIRTDQSSGIEMDLRTDDIKLEQKSGYTVGALRRRWRAWSAGLIDH